MKKNLRHLILLLTAALLLIGCSEDSQTTRPQQTALHNGKSLGTLQTREKIIRLETDGKFSVLDLNRRPVALSLSKSEFQEKFPQLYRDFEKAVAREELENITPDASLTTPKTEILK
ncbi:MAG: hypothetical protein A2173_05990 [Planctomycetes bacterium RBG_13_44_8b]|nr:MAG: hypothetical protein A2173_05990 [Planctomycetes bacterium RBG_13_44_8b]